MGDKVFPGWPFVDVLMDELLEYPMGFVQVWDVAGDGESGLLFVAGEINEAELDGSPLRWSEVFSRCLLRVVIKRKRKLDAGVVGRGTLADAVEGDGHLVDGSLCIDVVAGDADEIVGDRAVVDGAAKGVDSDVPLEGLPSEGVIGLAVGSERDFEPIAVAAESAATNEGTKLWIRVRDCQKEKSRIAGEVQGSPWRWACG